ncbi:MAG: GTP cyclohydrolase II [Myxococcales bacterium]|nr:GTP cyclohydrolase II [Myxococcales bacterium]
MAESTPYSARIDAAISALRKGRMVLLMQSTPDAEEGALVVLGMRTTPDHINFMSLHARGLICVAISRLRAERLRLQPQSPNSRHPRAEDVLTSIEARTGVSTGISAADRARTVRVLADERSEPDDLVGPGHVFPVTVESRGVFGAQKIPEGATDLARLAGFPPVGTYCKILGADGEILGATGLQKLAEEYNLPQVSIEDIMRTRVRQEVLVQCEETKAQNTRYGHFTAHTYRSEFDDVRHLALVHGNVTGTTPLVRIHSQCLTGDVFGSLRCDCGAQLEMAMEQISNDGAGIIVYLLQEGRGIGLTNKVRAYALQDKGQDTVEANLSLGFQADLRDFSVAAHVLEDLGVHACRLMTNNPRKIEQLENAGIEITERISLETSPDDRTRTYLKAKKDKLGHLLNQV